MGVRKEVTGRIIKIFAGYGFIRVSGESQDIYFDFGLLAYMPGIHQWKGGIQPRQEDMLTFDCGSRNGQQFVTRVHAFQRSPYTKHRGLLKADYHVGYTGPGMLILYSIWEDGYRAETISHYHIDRLGVRPTPWTGGYAQDEVQVWYHRAKKGYIDQSTVRLML